MLVPNIIIVIIAFLIETLILIGHVWFDKFRQLDRAYECWLITGFRAILFIFLTNLSFIFIDFDIKLILGYIGYGNFLQHLATIVLTILIGVQLIIGINFVKPNYKGLITFAIVLIVFLSLSILFSNADNLNELVLYDGKYAALITIIVIPSIAGIISVSLLLVLEILVNRLSADTDFKDIPFWDIQSTTKKIFGLKFNLILFLLISSELILNLQGLSLLLWLTFFF